MTCKAPLIIELKACRQKLGWSVKEVGERCGIDEKFLPDWDHGAGSPRLDAVESWAASLGLNWARAPPEGEARHGLSVDWNNRRISIDGAPVRLTPMEWKALERLARTPGELVAHQALFRHLYGDERPYRAQSTAVRVLITKLRRLLPLRIEAQWGRGYVVSGLEPSSPHAANGNASLSNGIANSPPPAEPPQPDHVRRVPYSPPQNPVRLVREPTAISQPVVRRTAAPPAHLAACRAEELGVIERFLAERGATRCPDVATIQQSPLPTLFWDKVKRKWVRPTVTDRQAS